MKFLVSYLIIEKQYSIGLDGSSCPDGCVECLMASMSFSPFIRDN